MTVTKKPTKKTSLNGAKKVAKKALKKKYNGAFADDGLGDTMLTLDWRKIKTVKPKYE